MKTLKAIKTGLAIFLSVFPLASCTGERDMPEEPETDLTANITIAELIARYGKINYADIDTTLYIEGVVVGNDISGNIYKKIYVQDSTGGIDVEIEMTNNYHKYALGQRLVIDLKGLAFGLYGGQPQIAGQGNNVTVRLYEPQCEEHLYRKGFASAANLPEPLLLRLVDIENYTMRYVGRLVRIDSVRFDDAGDIFVIPETAATTGNAMDRRVSDRFGNSLATRNSAKALFATDTIPYGTGSIQGILGVYNGTPQLFFRDINDVIGFSKMKPAAAKQ